MKLIVGLSLSVLLLVASATTGEVISSFDYPSRFSVVPHTDLVAQSTFCGTDADNAPGTRPTYQWQNHFVSLTRLGSHWMPGFGNGDSMSRPLWSDKGTSFPYGSQGLQETWYIGRESASNRAPFYGFYISHEGNHKDGPYSTDSGYTNEILHGYPWTTQLPGTQPLRRYYRSLITDHRTWLLNTTPLGYTVNQTYWPGGATPRLGYERFGNFLDKCNVLASAYGTYLLQNSIFTIDFNKIWGGAIGRLTYRPTGVQLVSEAIGDMVQSTVWFGTSADPPGTCCIINPTESGGADTWNYSNTKKWAGSPILSQYFSGSNPRSWIREIKPFNFTTNAFQGNNPWSPLLWRGTFRKTTTIGHQIGGSVYGDVIRTVLEAKLDADAPSAMDGLYNLNNVFWLRMSPYGDGELGNFAIELFDIATNTASPISHPDWLESIYIDQPSNDAIIVSNAGDTFAIGVWRPGQPSNYKVMFWCSSGARPCPPDNQLLVIDVFDHRVLSRVSYSLEEAYFVAGSTQVVKQRLRQMNGY